MAQDISISEEQSLQEKGGVAQFWCKNMTHFLSLSKNTLRILAIPVSNSSIERGFSLLKNVITDSRTRLGEDIVEDPIYARSALCSDE